MDDELKRLSRETRRAIRDPEWAKKMVDKIGHLLIADLKGEIDLCKPLTKLEPYFQVRIDQKTEQIYMCVKLNDKHCNTCWLTKLCACKS